MKRQIAEMARVVFISFEFLFVVALVFAALSKPSWFVFVGSEFRNGEGAIEWAAAIPLALCAFVWQQAWKLTTPLEGTSSRELLDWPDYWRVRIRRNCALVFSSMAAVAAIGAWVFSRYIDEYWIGLVMIGSLSVAAINASCMAFAALTLREILEP